MALPSGAEALFEPWGSRTLEPGRSIALRIGARDLWLRREGGEIWLAHHEESALSGPSSDPPPTEPPSPELPEDVEWARWATPGGEREILCRPALPDRTVVLKPERSFRLLNRAEARVFVRVPLWIRLELVPADEGELVLLDEIPSLAMSDTWWGDFLEGELAWWLPTTARREMRPELHLPHLAVCPLRLVNRSGSDLAVEKLAFRVPHLSLFVHDGHFWADQARVTYRGDAEGSQIDMDGRSPEEARGGVRVAQPRTALQKGFRARTFDRLKHLPGVGGGQ